MRQLLLLAGLALAAAPAAARPAPQALAPFAGTLAEIFLHESGHAVTMLSLGIGVESFRPFPNICGGKLVGGCVIPGASFGKGILPIRSGAKRSILVSAMGSGSSILGALALSPQLPKIRNEFNRQTLAGMTYLEVRDLPFYVVFDLVGFKGDWYNVAQAAGISLWWFVPVAAGEYVALDRYQSRYARKAEAKFAATAGAERRASLPKFYLRFPALTL